MKAKCIALLILIATTSIFAGCAGEMDFERVTGPLSPGAIAWMFSGGLRERLFPGSQKAFEICMEDPTACMEAGGYKLQVAAPGKVVLNNLKTMLALQLSG